MEYRHATECVTLAISPETCTRCSTGPGEGYDRLWRQLLWYVFRFGGYQASAALQSVPTGPCRRETMILRQLLHAPTDLT